MVQYDTKGRTDGTGDKARFENGTGDKARFETPVGGSPVGGFKDNAGGFGELVGDAKTYNRKGAPQPL